MCKFVFLSPSNHLLSYKQFGGFIVISFPNQLPGIPEEIKSQLEHFPLICAFVAIVAFYNAILRIGSYSTNFDFFTYSDARLNSRKLAGQFMLSDPDKDARVPD